MKFLVVCNGVKQKVTYTGLVSLYGELIGQHDLERFYQEQVAYIAYNWGYVWRIK